MAYTTTITWAAETLNADSDTYQLIMTFTHDDSGSNRSWAAADYNLVILDQGKVRWEYEMEDALLTPGVINLVISDIDRTLDDLFFGQDAVNILVEKQAKVEIKINGTTDFIGHIIENTILSDYGERTISFTAAPRIDIINKQMVFKDSVVPIDPFDYIYTKSAVNITNVTYEDGEVTVTHDVDVSLVSGEYVKISSVGGMTDLNNVFVIHDQAGFTSFKVYLYTEQTYTSGGSYKEENPGSSTFKNVVDMMVDIYQLVNSGLGSGDIEINQDWDFDAGAPDSRELISNAVYSTGQVTITHASMTALNAGDVAAIIDVGGMTDLNGEHIVASGTTTQTVVTLTTAQSYTSGGYIKEYRPADFEDIKLKMDAYFYHTTAGFSTVGDILKNLALTFFSFTGMVHEDKAFFKKLFHYESGNLQTLDTVNKFIKGYRYSLLDYVKVQAVDFDIVFEEDKQMVAEAGTFTEMAGKSLILENIPIWSYTLDLFFLTLFYSSIRDDNDVLIYFLRDTALDNDWHSNVHLIANLWYNFRNSMQNCRVDRFEVKGIDYDVLKSFNKYGYKYQIIMMEKLYSKNITNIEAIFLGAV